MFGFSTDCIVQFVTSVGPMPDQRAGHSPREREAVLPPLFVGVGRTCVKLARRDVETLKIKVPVGLGGPPRWSWSQIADLFATGWDRHERRQKQGRQGGAALDEPSCRPLLTALPPRFLASPLEENPRHTQPVICRLQQFRNRPLH